MNAWVWPSSSWCFPSVETQVIGIVPPRHPCLFPFFFFSSFILSLLLFSVFPFFFRFFVFRLFLVSPSSLFLSLPCSPWWRILFFSFGATSPLRCLRACKSAYSPCVVFFSCVVHLFLIIFLPFLPYYSCVVDLYLFIFLPFLPYFSISIWTSFASSCLVLVATWY